MDDFEHPLRRQHGRYRPIALPRRPRHAGDPVRAYAITMLAGARLREEPTQARALQWIDARVASEAAAVPLPTTRPARARRR